MLRSKHQHMYIVTADHLKMQTLAENLTQRARDKDSSKDDDIDVEFALFDVTLLSSSIFFLTTLVNNRKELSSFDKNNLKSM